MGHGNCQALAGHAIANSRCGVWARRQPVSSVSSRFFDLPGLRVHTLVCGDPAARPAVLLHGFPELSESWRAMLPLLAAAGFYAVAPDLRGYGQTGKPRAGY